VAADAAGGAPLSTRRRALGLVAGLLILAFLVAGAISGWSKVDDFHWQVEPAKAVAGFAALLGMYAVNALGYVLILEQLAGHRVPRRRIAAVWARSLLGRYVPGNVLMVASRLVLGQEAGISRKVSLAASVYEQALSLGAAAAGGLVLLAAYGAGQIGPAAWLVALVPAGLVVLHPQLFGRVTGWLLRRVRREPLEVLLSGRQVLGLLAWYLLGAVLLALGIGLLVHSVVGSDGGSLLYVGVSFLTSFVLSMLAFVFPSGLGLREGAFALALGRNLPGGVAIAIAAGTRLALTLVELVFVGAMVLLDHAARRAEPINPK
jgi:glycosyltransferase 2 family protein